MGCRFVSAWLTRKSKLCKPEAWANAYVDTYPTRSNLPSVLRIEQRIRGWAADLADGSHLRSVNQARHPYDQTVGRTSPDILRSIDTYRWSTWTMYRKLWFVVCSRVQRALPSHFHLIAQHVLPRWRPRWILLLLLQLRPPLRPPRHSG